MSHDFGVLEHVAILYQSQSGAVLRPGRLATSYQLSLTGQFFLLGFVFILVGWRRNASYDLCTSAVMHLKTLCVLLYKLARLTMLETNSAIPGPPEPDIDRSVAQHFHIYLI